MHDLDDLERRGIPSVFVASSEFIDAADTQRAALGSPVRGVFVAHPIQDRTDDEMTALADAAVDDLIAALTQPSG